MAKSPEGKKKTTAHTPAASKQVPKNASKKSSQLKRKTTSRRRSTTAATSSPNGRTTAATRLKKVVIRDGRAKVGTRVASRDRVITARSKSITQQTSVKERTTLFFGTLARLPLRADRYAAPFARMSGVAFVLLGGIFTLFFAQHVWGSPLALITGNMNTAMVCSQSTTTSSCTSTSSTQTTATTTSNTGSTPNQARPAQFSIATTSPLKGIVAVTIGVADATQVNVLAYENGSSTPLLLGAATEGLVAGTWVFRWDTRQYPDAHYKLAADIFNAYYAQKPYRSIDTNTYDTQNHLSTTTITSHNLGAPTVAPTSTIATTTTTPTAEPPVMATTSPTATSSSSSTTTTLTAEPIVKLSVDSSILVNQTGRITVAVPYATAVALYVRADATGAVQFLGDAYQADATTWHFTWNTTAYANGSYHIFALVKNYTGSYKSAPYPLTLRHSTTHVASTTMATTVPATTTPPKELPPVSLSVPTTGPLSGTITALVHTHDATLVELHATPQQSTVDHFLGLAEQADAGTWSLLLNTHNVPNGTYLLFARVKNAYGTYDSNKLNVRIYNKPQEVPLTKQQTNHVHVLAANGPVSQPMTFRPVQPLRPRAATTTSDVATTTNPIARAVAAYGPQLDTILQRYAAAFRVHDTTSMKLVQRQLDALRKQIVTDLTTGTKANNAPDAAAINSYIQKRIQTFIAALPQVDALLTTRLGVDVSKDSDHDGISDYDEVNIYHTNPYSADTDGDGIPDGVEIMNGTDPLNPNNGTQAMQYQLPQDNGVQRSDLLSVTNITAATSSAPAASPTTSSHAVAPTKNASKQTSTSSGATTSSAAVIAGQGLPDSFVTLYVFSTPVIVTVHTNPDGTWEYRFDKQLPNGHHTIYVGITDSSGKIIAKSAPFNFIKQANAYTKTDAAVAAVADQPSEGSLLSQNMLYLVVSISVATMGLILILLGLHLEARRRRTLDLLGPEPVV